MLTDDTTLMPVVPSPGIRSTVAELVHDPVVEVDLKLIPVEVDLTVSGASFLTGGVIECNIAHRRSVAVLCMLYKIRCSLITLSLRCSILALVAHRYTYLIARCITSHYRRTIIPFSVSLWNNLLDPVFDAVGLAAFQEEGQCFFIGLSCSIYIPI